MTWLSEVPMRRKAGAAAALACAALLLAGCGSSPSATSSTTTSSTTPASASSTTDLAVTSAVRAALLNAGAAGHSLPVADFTGLEKGLTFYAYDPADGLYWAGTRLVPSPSSMAAQVSVQDDGGYDVFTKSASGAWTDHLDGLGTQTGAHCAIVVPSAVRGVWGWSKSTPCGGPAD